MGFQKKRELIIKQGLKKKKTEERSRKMNKHLTNTQKWQEWSILD